MVFKSPSVPSGFGLAYRASQGYQATRRLRPDKRRGKDRLDTKDSK